MSTEQPEAPTLPGVTRWRKKPIEITAIQFTGTNVDEIWDAFGAAGIYGPTETNPDHLILTTVHGDEAPARAGDWIIPDAAPDTFYPCKPDVFARTYEPAETPDAESPAPVPAERSAEATQPAEGIGALLEASARDGIGEYLGELADALGIGARNRPGSVHEAMHQCLTWASHWRNRAGHQQARAEAAEAKLAEIEALCCHQRASAPESVRTPTVAVVRILAILGTEGGADLARHLVAQAKVADAEYKVAEVRVTLYEFLHQYGQSELPAFKIAIDLASSLRKIIDDLGGEEGSGLRQRPGDQRLPVPNDGPSMHDLVADDVRRRHPGGRAPEIADVVRDLAARKQLGLERYGSLLQAGNGRDALRDLHEEQLDSLVYCRQWLEENDEEHAWTLVMRRVYRDLLTGALTVRRVMDDGNEREETQ